MYFASLLSAPKRAWRYVWAGEFKGSGPYTVADGMDHIMAFYRDCSGSGYEVRRKHIHHPFVRIKEKTPEKRD